MSIIKIDGKPLEKLIDVISKGIGKLYQPTEIKKIADAEAYKIEVIAKAKTKSKISSTELTLEAQTRIDNRLSHQEARRQLNIENITFKAAELLQHETSISSEDVDEDWIARFFDNIKDVSNEDMQILWSRILSGEVQRPRSFSLRTLEFLKNMSQADATLLTKVSEFAITIEDFYSFMLYKPIHKMFTEKWDFPYGSYTYLIELGILSSEEADFFIPDLKRGSKLKINYGSTNIEFERIRDDAYFGITSTPFTQIGNELLRLISPERNEEYLKQFLISGLGNRKDIICTTSES